jgi:hypothetical protein
MKRFIAIVVAAAVIVVLGSGAALAQPASAGPTTRPAGPARDAWTQPAPPSSSHPRFELDALFENDSLRPIAPTDRHYTSGEKLVAAYWPDWADDLAAVMPLHGQYESAGHKPSTAAGIVVGQDIYTPDHINNPDLQSDWPYAGWLYTGFFW